MLRVIKKIYHLIIALNKTIRLKLTKELKNKIRATYFRVNFLEIYDSKHKIANIVRFKVKFYTYEELAYLFNEIFINQEYYFISKTNSPYIIDCGSNIGMSILYFKMLYPDSSILAFEPSEEVFSCLESNIRNNNLNSIIVNKIALSNKEGAIYFYYDKDNLDSLVSSIKQERMPKQKRTVEASVLSKYIDRDVDFLKMDVEGAELEIIEELSNKGKLNYVKQMVIEYHHHIVRDSDIFSKLLRLLEDAGFGYQIESHLQRPLISKQFQDILIYAYQKNSTT